MRNLLYTIGSCFLIAQVHFLFTGDAQWYAFVIGLMAQQFLVCVVLFSRIPYEKLAEKHLAFLMCVLPVFEAFLFIATTYYHFAFIVTSCVSITWLTWTACRPYRIPSAGLTDTYVCKIAKPPNSFVTFLASIFRVPLGRFSFYINGTVYHFHHDYFTSTPIDRFPLAGAVVIHMKTTATDAVEAHLKGMLGCKWGLFTNCLTVRLTGG